MRREMWYRGGWSRGWWFEEIEAGRKLPLRRRRRVCMCVCVCVRVRKPGRQWIFKRVSRGFPFPELAPVVGNQISTPGPGETFCCRKWITNMKGYLITALFSSVCLSWAFELGVCGLHKMATQSWDFSMKKSFLNLWSRILVCVPFKILFLCI